MKRNEFAFSIGYSGKSAVVDKKALGQYGRLTSAELAEKGLYRAAFASALYGGDEGEMRNFIDLFSKKSGRAFTRAEELSRVFGVYPVKAEVKATLL